MNRYIVIKNNGVHSEYSETGEFKQFSNSCMWISINDFIRLNEPLYHRKNNITVGKLREIAGFDAPNNKSNYDKAFDFGIPKHIQALLKLLRNLNLTLAIHTARFNRNTGQLEDLINVLDNKPPDRQIHIYANGYHFELITKMIDLNGRKHNYINNPEMIEYILKEEIDYKENIIVDKNIIAKLNNKSNIIKQEIKQENVKVFVSIEDINKEVNNLGDDLIRYNSKLESNKYTILTLTNKYNSENSRKINELLTENEKLIKNIKEVEEKIKYILEYQTIEKSKSQKQNENIDQDIKLARKLEKEYQDEASAWKVKRLQEEEASAREVKRLQEEANIREAKLLQEQEDARIALSFVNQSGGGYKHKYLKYKQKYLLLKKKNRL
jgi:hypothetical protein